MSLHVTMFSHSCYCSRFFSADWLNCLRISLSSNSESVLAWIRSNILLTKTSHNSTHFLTSCSCFPPHLLHEFLKVEGQTLMLTNQNSKNLTCRRCSLLDIPYSNGIFVYNFLDPCAMPRWSLGTMVRIHEIHDHTTSLSGVPTS